ncbi:MAG: hypothetical protein H6747_10760 [Deltaproteobacteria bacterium]|nr:hypothetical protein [Deltaproteobacteria bacterium]
MMVMEWSFLDDRSAADQVDALTWGKLRIDIASQCVTDVAANTTRRSEIYVPLFPIASWLVRNWWSLLYEPNPPDLGGILDTATATPWALRHCLRTARAGIALPNLSIFSDGDALRAVWVRDQTGLRPHTPVEFATAGEARFDRTHFEQQAARLVDSVLERLVHTDDPRVSAVRTDWQATASTASDEIDFCVGAGRVGLDPFAVDAWPDGILDWFESLTPRDFQQSFIADLLDAPTDIGAKARSARPILDLVDERTLNSHPEIRLPRRLPTSAYERGYALAAKIRAALGVAPKERLDDLQRASSTWAKRAHQVIEVPDLVAPEAAGLRGVVGWQGRAQPIVLLAPYADHHERDVRFRVARGLYFALFGMAAGPRLITDARTWDQRASRAFAAELLAPRDGVLALHLAAQRSRGPEEAESSVADHYRVSSWVIRHQLDNARLSGGGATVAD